MRTKGMHGKTNFGCLFLSLLLIVGGYVGFQFGRVYLGKYMLDRKIFEIAGAAAQDWRHLVYQSDKDIADAVLKEARRHTTDITYDDIEIERDPEAVSITVLWEGAIVLPYYTHHYSYYFDHKRDFKY